MATLRSCWSQTGMARLGPGSQCRRTTRHRWAPSAPAAACRARKHSARRNTAAEHSWHAAHCQTLPAIALCVFLQAVSDGYSFVLMHDLTSITDWHTCMCAKIVQAKTAVDTGVHVQLRAAQPREPPLWLRQQPGHFDAAGTEHAATAPVDWADEAELTMRRAAAPAAVLDTVQQPHVKLERAETAGEGAPAAGGAEKDIKEAANGAVAANGSENAPGEGNKQEAGEGPGRASDASEAVAVPAKRPLQGADSPAALASPTAKALYGEELDAEPAGTAQQPYGMHHPARAPHALAPSHAPQAQPYAQSGAPPPWAPPQQFQSEHQQQYWHAHAPFQAQPPHAAPQHHLAVPPAHTFQQPQSDPEYQPPLPEEPYEPDTEDAPPLPPGGCHVQVALVILCIWCCCC